MKRNYKSIYKHVSSLPVFSDHEHHAEDQYFAGGDYSLDQAFGRSYAGWKGYPLDGKPESRRALIENMRFNSYYVWFEKGVQHLHGIKEPISVENWDRISAKMRKTCAADPDFHWKGLKKAGYERLILDAYWKPGDDDGHPEIFTPAFRIDNFMYAYHPDVVGPQGINAWKHFGIRAKTLKELVEFMKDLVRARHRRGKAVALKCAEAYNRSVSFQPDDEAAARRVFGKDPKKLSHGDKLLFGNYIFNRACELAGELKIPFQVHTGLAMISGSQPMNFEPTIARHPNVNFVMFHAGYPWIHQVAGLVHNYRNAPPSLTWTATISTSAAIRALHEYIDVAASIDTITWGSDCWVPEESVGAMLAWRHIVTTIIRDRLADGRMNARHADLLADKLMFGNGRKVYGVAPCRK